MPAYAYTMTINNEPEKKFAGEIRLELDGLSITEAIDYLSEVEIPDNCVETRIDFESDGDSYANAILYTYRMETPAEVAARVERAQNFNQTVRARRRAEYEAMKAEFEGNTNEI